MSDRRVVGRWRFGSGARMLCGAGAVSVAGQRNAVAVAGLVNGIGSIGPILQEQINGRILQESQLELAVRYSNFLGLSISVLFVVAMVVC